MSPIRTLRLTLAALWFAAFLTLVSCSSVATKDGVRENKVAGITASTEKPADALPGEVTPWHNDVWDGLSNEERLEVLDLWQASHEEGHHLPEFTDEATGLAGFASSFLPTPMQGIATIIGSQIFKLISPRAREAAGKTVKAAVKRKGGEVLDGLFAWYGTGHSEPDPEIAQAKLTKWMIEQGLVQPTQSAADITKKLPILTADSATPVAA